MATKTVCNKCSFDDTSELRACKIVLYNVDGMIIIREETVDLCPTHYAYLQASIDRATMPRKRRIKAVSA